MVVLPWPHVSAPWLCAACSSARLGGVDTGFPPHVGPQPRVLVLGSMPGRRSLDEGRYYAHPRNLFWPLMGEVAGFDAARLDYPERLSALAAAGVALWDVLAECERPGSLDASIVRGTERLNPLPELLHEHPGIGLVACNGGAALAMWRRRVWPLLGPGLQARLDVLGLPSTSPANASVPLATKRRAWLALRPWLGR